MTTSTTQAGNRALIQQGYDYSPRQLAELSWGLRFSPTVCMAFAIVGLITQQPAIHFVLAAVGILPFWFPAHHPVDHFYNRVLRPLWDGVRLPPNPLPRRIACLMGGAMNLGVGIAFTLGSTTWAYVLGGVLIALQLIVITTHFCVASWMYELLLRSLGQWKRPIAVDRIRELLGEGGVLIDVRSPAEFARGHAPDARNIPLDDIPAGFPEPGGPYLLYCMSGLRSQRAALLLAREGRADIYNVGAMSRLDALGG